MSIARAVRLLSGLAVLNWVTPLAAAPISSSHEAHFDLRPRGPVWELSIQVPRSTLHEGLSGYVGAALADSSTEEYRARLIQHVRDSLRLEANGQPLAVRHVAVGLSDPDSQLRVLLQPPSSAPQHLALRIATFASNPQQTNTLSVQLGKHPSWYALDASNDYQASWDAPRVQARLGAARSIDSVTFSHGMRASQDGTHDWSWAFVLVGTAALGCWMCFPRRNLMVR